jgi:predicted nucleic acid-binding protein
VRRDPQHDVIQVDAALESEAVERWMRARADKTYSLCDAVSFEVMRREKISKALAYDRHFASAGYQILSPSD